MDINLIINAKSLRSNYKVVSDDEAKRKFCSHN